MGDPGEDAGDGGYVPNLPRGHTDPRVSPDHSPLGLCLLGVGLGLVTIFVAEDVVSAEMQIATNCENRFGTPLYCGLERAKELEIQFEMVKHPCPRDQFFQRSGCMENSFTGCLGKV